VMKQQVKGDQAFLPLGKQAMDGNNRKGEGTRGLTKGIFFVFPLHPYAVT